MKKLFAKLFGGAGLDVADKIGGLVDKFVRTKDEKANFEKEMTLIFQEHELSLEKKYLQDIKRTCHLTHGFQKIFVQ